MTLYPTIIHTRMPLCIDKPPGWTSFDVVKKVRGLLQVKKIGHAGTLDPLATGLLILGVGKGTKDLARYQDLDKTYEGTLVLGKTTPSFDLETPFDSTHSYAHLQRNDIVTASKAFVGVQTQVPPAYSACKVDGVKAYTQARQGKKVVLKERQVTIHRFDILTVNIPSVDFKVSCTKGTYIRSLVHDLGQHLCVGAYLATLRRTHIGAYSIEDAHTIPSLEAQHRQGHLQVIDSA